MSALVNNFPSLSEQITSRFPKDSVSYRLILTTGTLAIPGRDDPPLPRTPFVRPQALPDGDYYVEFYDQQGHVCPEIPDEPVVVSYWRRKPPVPALPATPPPVPPPAPTPAAEPRAELSTHPDKWAYKQQIRQDHQMRDLGVDVFHQGVEQLKQIREIYSTLGQEQLTNQKLCLNYGMEIFEIQKKMLDQWRVEQEQRSKPKAQDDSPRATVDFTVLGAGLLTAIQAIAIAVVSRRQDAPKEEPERGKRPETLPKGASPERVMLVPEDQADQVVEELLKISSPLELQKLLTDPAQQKKFAARLGEIGSAKGPTGPLVNKSRGPR